MNVHAARLTTNALAAVCAILLLLFIAQYAGVGRGYHWDADADTDAARVSAAAIDKKPVKLPPIAAFADIDAHPLFNDDRKPTPADAGDGDADAAAPSPLNIALTGIILDEKNNVRVAMLMDKARNQGMALKVGMPLEGDQAGWTLVELKPRSAVFKSATNETTEVPLETAAAAAPAKSPRGRAPVRRLPNAAAGGATAANAQDLAHRIEERRKQMREDAERQRNQRNPRKPPAPPKK
jgi:general secretion pathway protein N